MVAAADILAKSMLPRVWNDDRKKLFLAAATRVMQAGGGARQVGGGAGRQKAVRGGRYWA